MDKQAQLKKFKWFASMLLVFMAMVYVLCEVVFFQYAWAGYVKAFAEAGMIGALADWFAVVALFKHPLGIPIPHTNLIESSKDKIGNNLGNFVISNFLTAETLRPRLKKLQVASRFGQWMIIDKNRKKVTAEILRIIKEAISKFNDEDITAIIKKQAEGLLDRMPVNKLVADGLEKVIHDDLHQDWLTTIALHLRDLLDENRDKVRKKVKEESYFLVPGFVDNMIAEKITNAGIEYMQNFATQKNHHARGQITQKLKSIAKDIQENGEWAARLNHLKTQLLSPENLHEYSGRLWIYIKKQIEEDLNKPVSAIGEYIDKVLYEMGESLVNDVKRQERIDRFIQIQALKLIMKYKESAGELISQTVTNWPSHELSQKLELEVGKDLQFIRVNGTIVGGMVGLTIYTLTQLFHS
ncbi:MAG: DUF445 family protein [Chitinophagaceae bacterium]|nr:DUF445 family protein [Chitinophagaceae bacterium]